MRLTTSYEVLMKTLGSISSVVDDSMSSEELRNILFKVSEKELYLVGINSFINYKRKLEVGDFRVAFDTWDKLTADNELIFQVNSKELTGFLNTFKSLRKTVPSDIIFEINSDGVKIVMTVIEDDLEDVTKQNASKWLFDNVAIKQSMIHELNQKVPSSDEPWSSIETNKILYYTANLIPVVSTESSGTLYNLLTFADDFVVAFNQKFSTLVSNMLPDEFKGITLNYKAIAFMKNVICSETFVSVSKTANQLVFKTETSEAFIKFGTKMASYKPILDSYKDTSGVSVDRMYFKDVLKRLSLVNETISFVISPDCTSIKVSNSKFSQEVPILASKGMDEFGEVRLKARPQVFSEGIIGDDASFAPELLLYFAKTANGACSTIITDTSKQWITVANLR